MAIEADVALRGRSQSTHDMLESDDFKSLARRRWTVSIILTAILFVMYYGFILLIGYNKDFMNQKVGDYTTVGIVLGVAVIVVSFILTAIYVIWANSSYDPEVKRLKDQLG